MPETLNNRRIPLKRIRQISDSHCGPAVIQMLLNFLKISLTQKEIAKAGEAIKIKKYGMRIDQLALAVEKLTSSAFLWYLDHASIMNIAKIINEYHYPVGIEWQGIFGKDYKRSGGDQDYGHYSVINKVDTVNKKIYLIDPYYRFSRARSFSFKEFLPRWWDSNEIFNKQTGKRKVVKDHQLFFIITPKSATFPLQLKMKKYSI